MTKTAITKAQPPIHIAIIMDGNRRWAKEHSLPIAMGHKKGAEAVREVVETAAELGVKYLTLYAFSTENWQRPQEEVDTLMNLLRKYLKDDIKDLMKNDVKILFIGERAMLDSDIIHNMEEVERQTADNQKICVCIAISYGSRQEIVTAVKKIANLVKKADILPEDVDIKMFSDMLYTRGVPDPDLVIRTSGEQRISNYLLWQIAYAEFFFSPVLWPDFNKIELTKVIENFNSRERRYGKN